MIQKKEIKSAYNKSDLQNRISWATAFRYFFFSHPWPLNCAYKVCLGKNYHFRFLMNNQYCTAAFMHVTLYLSITSSYSDDFQDSNIIRLKHSVHIKNTHFISTLKNIWVSLIFFFKKFGRPVYGLYSKIKWLVAGYVRQLYANY